VGLEAGAQEHRGGRLLKRRIAPSLLVGDLDGFQKMMEPPAGIEPATC
jgi:hypothetical protein